MLPGLTRLTPTSNPGTQATLLRMWRRPLPWLPRGPLNTAYASLGVDIPGQNTQHSGDSRGGSGQQWRAGVWGQAWAGIPYSFV